MVENLQRRVAELNVRSPVNGMVANLGQPEKARIAESAPVVTVVDLGAAVRIVLDEREHELRGVAWAGKKRPGHCFRHARL